MSGDADLVGWCCGGVVGSISPQPTKERLMAEQPTKLIVGEPREPTWRSPKRLRRIRRRLAERGLDRRVDRRVIPYEAGKPIEQSPLTTTGPNPGGEQHE